jgi:hypothetical protein
MRRGIEALRVGGDLRQSLGSYGNLAWALMYVTTARDALAVYDEGVAFARDYGLDDLDFRTNRLDALDFVGAHDELVAEARELKARAMQRGNAYATVFCELQVDWVRIVRGEPLGDPEEMVEADLSVGLPRSGFAPVAARAALGRNDPELARRIIVDGLDAIREGATVYAAVDNVAVALDLDDLDLAHRILSKSVPPGPTGRGYLSMLATALVDEADGEIAAAHAGFAEAETYFEARGWVWLRANALAGVGRCLAAMGDLEAGVAALRQARSIGEPLRAKPFIARVDAIIAASTVPQPDVAGTMRRVPAVE